MFPYFYIQQSPQFPDHTWKLSKNHKIYWSICVFWLVLHFYSFTKKDNWEYSVQRLLLSFYLSLFIFSPLPLTVKFSANSHTLLKARYNYSEQQHPKKCVQCYPVLENAILVIEPRILVEKFHNSSTCSWSLFLYHVIAWFPTVHTKEHLLRQEHTQKKENTR